GEGVDGELVKPARGHLDLAAGLPVDQLDLGTLPEDGVDAAADHPGPDAENDTDLGVGRGQVGVAGGGEVPGGHLDQLGGGEPSGGVAGEVVGVQEVGEATGAPLQQAGDHDSEPGRRLWPATAAAGPPTSRSPAGSVRR